MKEGTGTSLIISIIGFGLAVGGLAPSIDPTSTVIFAVGMGIVLGGVFRALLQIERRIVRTQSPSTGAQSGQSTRNQNSND